MTCQKKEKKKSKRQCHCTNTGTEQLRAVDQIDLLKQQNITPLGKYFKKAAQTKEVQSSDVLLVPIKTSLNYF